jgi:sugar phosphate isomerase/epimerase
VRDLSRDTSLLSLNTATLGWERTIREAVEACERFGVPAIDPWRHQMHAGGFAGNARLIRSAGLEVTGLCRGGFFVASDAAGRDDAMDDNRRAVDEALELGARCLVLVAGGLADGSRDLAGARRRVFDAIAELAAYARPAGMPLAIEPMHPMYCADRGCVNTLGHALDLCEALGEGVGVVIDVYHVWWDPDLEAQILRAGRGGRILAYHVCDWRRETRDLLFDRAMMGDGVIELKKIRALVEGAGYDGPCEVEIFSKLDWWKRPVDEIVRTCVERHRSVV